jgi:hypothetical protein
MKLWQGKGKDALGIHIDGEQVRVAHLRRQGERVVLAGISCTTLKQRLDLEEEAADNPAVEEESDILGLDGGEEKAPQVEEATGSNMEVLYELLKGFPAKDSTLAFSVAETGVFYTDCEDFGLEGKKLKQRLIEEAERNWGAPAPDAAPFDERLGYFRAGQDRLVSVLHEDALEMLGLLDQLEPFIGSVRVGLIEPVEVTLMNLVRRTAEPQEGVTAILYVGEDYSRIVFMQDNEYLGLSQPIYSGAKEEGIVQLVCSRLQYERDIAELPEITQLLLVGNIWHGENQVQVAEYLPGVQVQTLNPALFGLEMDGEDELAELLPHFAVAVGLAWKALSPKDARFYPVNFLPEARRRRQNPLELAGHGVGLLALVLGVGLYVGVEARELSRQIEFSRLDVELTQQRIEQDGAIVGQVDELHARIGEHQHYFALVDSLGSARTPLAGALRQVAEAVERTDSVWLERIATSEAAVNVKSLATDRFTAAPERFYLSGKSLYRNRVSRLARRFDEENIRSMVRSQIRQRAVYDFDITVPLTGTDGGSLR